MARLSFRSAGHAPAALWVFAFSNRTPTPKVSPPNPPASLALPLRGKGAASSDWGVKPSQSGVLKFQFTPLAPQSLLRSPSLAPPVAQSSLAPLLKFFRKTKNPRLPLRASRPAVPFAFHLQWFFQLSPSQPFPEGGPRADFYRYEILNVRKFPFGG